MALSEYYRIHRISLSIRFSGINAVVCFYFFLDFYKICVIQHKNPPADETVGGYAAGRSPCKSFKSSDIICDTGEKNNPPTDNHRRIVSADSAPVCTERFRYFENSGQRSRKISRLR